MEHCPNCGTASRSGAKFCTTCGFRFPGDESNSIEATGSINTVQQSDVGEPAGITAETAEGWPTPPSSVDPASGGWGQPAGSLMSASTESPDESAVTDISASSWPQETVDSWPARPAADTTAPVSISPSIHAVEPEPVFEDMLPVAQDGNAEMISRAMSLLDELRDTISAIGASTALDLREVISELEVAVTPPGAMATDDVAELREALLAARERPRDVDTIVDLTKRIDAMVTLVIAYDRTIAAIERSLDVLRSDDDR